ncbi:MAG TPA: DUF177 domain-containing protein [Stellaceae bacterium]|nr:DUF177 domain-containing protein [Stellaceae bacterium]
MSDPAPEFSRPMALTRIGSQPFRQKIAANEAERAALAKRFSLVSLDHLEATVELALERGGTILLTAEFSGAFAQECVVSLDPVAGSVQASFSLRYGPAEAEPVTDSDEEPAFEPLTGDAVDIGEAVAQEFSLSLPPFPRAPDAVIDEGPSELADDGPFAALAWRKRDD